VSDGRPYILELPQEMLLLIASFIPSAQNFSKLASTCHALHSLFQDPKIWKTYFTDYGFLQQPDNVDEKFNWRSYFYERARVETVRKK
jgi:hypothetical protein